MNFSIFYVIAVHDLKNWHCFKIEQRLNNEFQSEILI